MQLHGEETDRIMDQAFMQVFNLMRVCKCFHIGAIALILQVLLCGVTEQSCSPGFDSELYVFDVNSVTLHVGRRLGKVVFHDCTGRTQTPFETADKRFRVDTDGTVKVKRRVTLRDGHERLLVHGWDPLGRKHTVAVHVELHQPLYQYPHQHRDLHQIVAVQRPKLSGGLRRRKREWVIPPYNIPENHRGPFPQKMFQIKTDLAKKIKVIYRITGDGANTLFKIDPESGQLYVTGQLDREKKAAYWLNATAESVTGDIKEDPTQIEVRVTDQNDNKPVCERDIFSGNVSEASKIGTEVITVVATDADEPNNANSDIRYKILSQNPPLLNKDTFSFSINNITGKIHVDTAALDKEEISEYTLEIQAADYEGEGLNTVCKAIITITDDNDHAPQFDSSQYMAAVPENQAGEVVVKMYVTDRDEPNTPAWAAKFKIISGNTGGVFSVETGHNKQEGLIKTAKPLDFEGVSKYTLLVAVENEIPFVVPLPTSTAQVVVHVEDVNEPPFFSPAQINISKPENIPVDTALLQYEATDPDTARKQGIMYKIGSDPADLLNVDEKTGMIKVKSLMDRESQFWSTVVQNRNGQYKALILAMDDDTVPETGTGTLYIELEDVNDNPPAVVERNVWLCNVEPVPVVLNVMDKDGKENGPPYYVQLTDDSDKHWNAEMNDTKTGIILNMKYKLPRKKYNISLTVGDQHGLSQESTVDIEVCNCKGANYMYACKEIHISEAYLPWVAGGILALLLLVLLLVMLLRRKTKVTKKPFLPEDDLRDNICNYNEEGGGEDDQDYDLGMLHRALDNRPEVFRNDIIPTFIPLPQYQPRPANPDDIGDFIDENLKAADNDPTAPPYDSLLVFDHEGAGSEAGTLSSLNSSCSGDDQDYDFLSEWGPRFQKLADMFGRGEEEE